MRKFLAYLGSVCLLAILLAVCAWPVAKPLAQGAERLFAATTAQLLTGQSTPITCTADGAGGCALDVGLSGTTLNAGRLPVLADINNTSEVDEGNNAIVVGEDERDASSTGNRPVLIGACGSTAVPTAMSTDDDVTCIWTTRNGAVHVLSTAGTSTLTNTNDTGTSTALLAAATGRLHAVCHNDSTSILYINYGATASATAYTYRVEPGGTWTMDPTVYTGAINGIWSADASGAARCTELTQ